MPSSFPFIEICTLLSNLEKLELHDPPLLATAKKNASKEVIEGWFKSHRRKITELDVDGQTALLSTLLPEWRTDRVYGIQAPRLCRMLSRTLGLGTTRRQDLEAYRQPGRGDLAVCLERVHQAGGAPLHTSLLLDEVEKMLESLAGGSRFSGPKIPKLARSSSAMHDPILDRIIHRATPIEAKWIARLILKNFSPLQIEEHSVFKNFHFLLPDLLRFQRDFREAVGLLKNELNQYHAQPDPRSQRLFRLQASKHMRPTVGTKVGRPTYHKAWTIDQVVKMAGSQAWVLERKYDGEYCEIHVDLAFLPDREKCIKIFAKSGRDATRDHAALHSTLVQSLRLGENNCRLKQRAIFLGELVVFSDDQNGIMPFDEIRKHVTRSGVRLGADADSQPRSSEHLAIVFFDLLLLDDEVVMNKPVEERRQWLRESYKKIHGRTIGAEWKVLDFTQPDYAKRKLVEQFSHATARRCEGLVLKPCGVPYFSLDTSAGDYKHSYIKVKKDYINGLGDEADFAVIGASWNVQNAAALRSTRLHYTSFHLGCLTNKDDVRRFGAQPVYKYVWTIDSDKCVPKPILDAVNTAARFKGKSCAGDEAQYGFKLESHTALNMDIVFEEPFVFEVLGSGFEKPSNCKFLMLRHPRVKKLHGDRTYMDCITFQELQEQGAAARAAPKDSESQETLRWIAKIENGGRRKFERERTATPKSTRSRTLDTPRTSVVSCTSMAGIDREGSGDPLPTPLPCSGVQRGDTSPLQHQLVSGRKRPCNDITVLYDASSKRPKLTPPTSSPLVDITNTVHASQRITARAHRKAPALSSITKRLVAMVRPGSIHECQSALATPTAACEGSACPFSNATVYLAPCIANTPYIAEDLMCSHNVARTPDLSHWDRNSFSHDPLTATVSESQAYRGMRKIILVEPKRRTATKSLVHKVAGLNQGRFKERVDVYDWRILEDCAHHDRGTDKVKRYFLGATMFDDTRKKALFVSALDWLRK